MRKIGIALVSLLLFLMGCVGTENNQQTVQTEADEIQLKEILNDSENSFSNTFTVEGKVYKVTAINTQEIHTVDNNWGEESQYYVYQVVMLDENEEILQNFFHEGKDDFAEVYCDDLNFDGYPDLEIISCHYEESSSGSIYLWQQDKNQFSSKEIELPRSYVVYKEQKLFSLKGKGENGESEILCRINEKAEIEELRSYTLNQQEKKLQIWDAQEERFLIKESIKLDENGDLVNAADYQAIFWSGLPGSKKELQTYWTVDTADYQVSLMDLIADESLQLVIQRKKEDPVIVHVYHKEEDYRDPSEFSANGFENLLGHDGFYIYNLYQGMFPYTYYFTVEENKLICLAESWGNATDDHMVDIDNDGERELICNVTYFADGAKRAIIYRYDGAQILQGSCHDLLDMKYDFYGAGSSYSEYLPEEYKVRIWFFKDEKNDFEYKDYNINLDKIEMLPYSKIY